MRILTLSDIHYRENYCKNDFAKTNDFAQKVELYFKSFKSKIEEIHSDVKIDMVLLGGDIAFSGKNKEYSQFKKIIRKAIPADIPIFSIVGNHEVNWSYLQVALGNDVNLPKLFDKTEKEIFSNKKFQDVFSDYFTSFQSEINDDIEFDFVYEFCDKAYAGYIYSEKDSLIILLLNSAFYSFGPGVVENFFEVWGKDKDRDTLLKEMPKLIGDTLSQEGKQSYFLATYPYFNKVNSLINENDLKVITCAHHPPSWLKWNELYSDDTSKRNFKTITDLSHILITGHLHNPLMEASTIRDTCYHINNGIFLDYHFVDKKDEYDSPMEVFPNNWFNILDIEQEDFEITPYKFHAEQIKGLEYEYKWLKKENLNKKYDFKVKPKSKSEGARPKNVRSKKFSKSENDKLQPYLPKNIGQLIKLLEQQRSNIFVASGNSSKQIKPDELIVLNKDGEDYLILLNRMEEMHDLLTSAASDFDKLLTNGSFGKIYEKLVSCKSQKLPIIAFYEVVESNDIDETEAFEKFYHDKILLFQSFKARFFSDFKELYAFTELNITFDTLMK